MKDIAADVVSASRIDDFRRDGAVCLRGAFDPSWLDTLARGIERDLAEPSPRLARHTKDPDAPAYIEDYWVWNDIPEFHSFVHDSHCGALAARLLEAPSINLVMDNWFLREAGARSRPPFHQDLAYFDFEGTMCVLWLPLEAVDRANGISFVRGSHLWDKLFMRVRFADGHQQDGPTPDAQSGVEVNGQRYYAPPDVAANPDAYELISWDLQPGDCIFFDMRTLHGGLADVVPTQTVRRFTLRMTAPDGMIRYRGDWAAGERAIFEAEGYQQGDRIAGPFFPQLYPPAAE